MTLYQVVLSRICFIRERFRILAIFMWQVFRVVSKIRLYNFTGRCTEKVADFLLEGKKHTSSSLTRQLDTKTS